jgi:rubrerythrin
MTSIFEVLHTKEALRIEEAAQQTYKKNATADKKKEELSTLRYFLICRTCFWCASFIHRMGDTQNLFVKTCPICNDNNIESLPLLYNERYYFEYTVSRGVDLEFFK